MTSKHRPNLLHRLLAWRNRQRPYDPADMGTEIGLEYFLAQNAGATAQPRGPAPSQPWQRRQG